MLCVEINVKILTGAWYCVDSHNSFDGFQEKKRKKSLAYWNKENFSEKWRC